jgi:hypothetical protein
MSLEFINFYLSGGSNNNNPNLSLGGLPSKYPISSFGINNLFDNVTAEQAKTGNTEYRCFYIFNDSEDKYLYNCSVYVIQTTDEGAQVQIGAKLETDVQKILISGAINSGSLKLGYENETFVIDWNGDLSDFANTIEYNLNNIPSLSDVIVQATGGGINRTITITFGGEDNNKNHELIKLINNNLTNGSSQPTISISKLVEGSPVNSVSIQTNFTELAPNEVTFFDTNINDRIFLGKLAPKDGCPIWIKRTINSNSIDAIEGDGFIFKLIGNLIKFD